MAKQIEGVYERLIECAKAEFLEKGFVDASLRTIAQNAGTSTSSIYVRFGDKEGLFDAIVGEHYQRLMTMFTNAQDDFTELTPEEQHDNLAEYSGDCLVEMLRYSYEHLDEVKIILLKSQGTRYANIVDEMVEVEVEATYRYQSTVEQIGIRQNPVNARLMHIIATGMFETFFELIIHEMPLDEALEYLRQMRAFYTAGWIKIMEQ